MKKILFLLLITLSQACQSAPVPISAATSYIYMQIFYSGPKSFPGSAFISFSPEFQNQKEIRLDEKINNTGDLSFGEMIKVQEERSQKMRDRLTKTLNNVTSQGWKIVQMSSYGDGGLVYLLRRSK